jgi:hypothetical protein
MLAMLFKVATASPILSLDVSATGEYTVAVDGQPWLESGITSFCADSKRYSTSDGSLVLASRVGPVGESDTMNLTWVPAGETRPRFVTSFVQSSTDTISFNQYFPDGVENAKGDKCGGKVASAFPSFKAKTVDTGPALRSISMGNQNTHSFDWKEAPPKATQLGVIVLYTSNNSALKTVVVSPQSNLMAADQSIEGGVFSSGIATHFASYPKGYAHQSLLVAGGRVSDTVFAWGNAMLAVGGKDRTEMEHPTDKSLTDLGYWTVRGDSDPNPSQALT